MTNTAATQVAAFLAPRITGQVGAQDGGVAIIPDSGNRDRVLALLDAFGYVPVHVGGVLVIPTAQLA